MTEKANILLVYPPITKHERYGSNLGIFGGKQIPLGIFYLAAYLRQHGYSVDAIDGEAMDMRAEDILAAIREKRIDVLGISMTTVAFHRALELATAVKRALPQMTVVAGGPHVSSQPSHPLSFDAFDYAVPHEGEITFLELIRHLEAGQVPHDVPGVALRHDGEVRLNPRRSFIKNLDSLPFPAYDLIPNIRRYTPPPFNYQKKPVANIITSRGCPNHCTFCERTTFGKRLRLRSAENIAAEIDYLINRLGVREIAFVDDTFTAKPARIYEIFELTRKRGLSFPWTCMSRVDTVDEALLKYMKANGCWYIAFGIESGDKTILKTIRKNIRLSDVRRVVEACRRLKITTKGFFMVGHPGETVETIDKTIDFSVSLKLDHIVVTINTPMPGSEQYRHVLDYGTLDEHTWAQFNYWHPVFVPHGMTQDILMTKHKEFLKRFYFKPRKILRAVSKILAHPDSPGQFAHVGSAVLDYALSHSR